MFVIGTGNCRVVLTNSASTQEKPMTVRPPKEMNPALLPYWAPDRKVYRDRNKPEWQCICDAFGYGVAKFAGGQVSPTCITETTLQACGDTLIPNIQQESPMSETIKALGMTFTPVETTVKGRPLSEFALGTPVVKAHNEGRCGHTPGKVVRLCGHGGGLDKGAYGLLQSNECIDLGSANEPIFYLSSEWEGNSPRSVPQTKKRRELKAGDVFEYDGVNWLVRDMKHPPFTCQGRLDGGAYDPDHEISFDAIVTVIGRVTWSRP